MTVGIVNIREAGSEDNPHVLKVVGCGGGGGNAVNRMIASGITSVEFIVANTDLQDLKSSLAPHKIQLGSRCTRGLGAGAKPEVGREAAMEDMDAIREHLAGADMVFITAGLGGGTGTGAAPVIAQIARELGCLTVGVVTKPFKFEGKVRQRNGEDGIINLRKTVDTLIVIPNDNLLLVANKKTSIVDAFTMADDVLRTAIQGISDLMNENGIINLDFADVKTIMSSMGQAIMGTGQGNGDNRAVEAAEKAIHSPLLDDCRIDGAQGIIINITGPQSLTLQEANEAATYIQEHADPEANIIFGVGVDESMPDDQVEVTVIATGFNNIPIEEEVPLRESETLRRPRSNFKVFTSGLGVPSNGSGDLDDDEPVPARDEEVPFLNMQNLAPIQSEPEFTPAFQKAAFQKPVVETALAPPPPIVALEDEDVYELTDSVLEQVETRPQIPDSYRPDENPGSQRSGQMETNLDIPTFIRKRSTRFPED